jgi:cell division protein ZapA
MRRPVEVEIMGQRLTVASDDSEEHVRQVAGFVDQRMRQLADARLPTASLHLALITALNIASEYWKLERQQEELRKTISRLAQRVSGSLGS